MFIGAQPRGVRDLIEEKPTSELRYVFCLQALKFVISSRTHTHHQRTCNPNANSTVYAQQHSLEFRVVAFRKFSQGCAGGPRGLLKKALNCCKVAKAGTTVLAGVGLCDDGQIFSTQEISKSSECLIAVSFKNITDNQLQQEIEKVKTMEHKNRRLVK